MRLLILLVISFTGLFTLAQNGRSSQSAIRMEVVLEGESIPYGTHYLNNRPVLMLPHSMVNDALEFRFLVADSLKSNFKILPDKEYEILDSLIFLDDAYFRQRIKFSNVQIGQRYQILYQLGRGNYAFNVVFYKKPQIRITEYSVELFKGEERGLDIKVDEPDLVDLSFAPTDNHLLEYQISRLNQGLRLDFKAISQGKTSLNIPLKSTKPFLNEKGEISYELESIKLDIQVQPARIRFLNVDKSLILFDIDNRAPIQVQFDYDYRFREGQSLRIENQAENGGRLIAELLVKNILGNNKVLCELYIYSSHRASENYLYIKENDKPLFITNFNVSPRPRINEVSLLRDNENWTNNLSVRPGEKVEIRIKGSGLALSDFHFVHAKYTKDTNRISSQTLFYEVEIPIDVDRRRISISLNGEMTGYELLVNEYQRAAMLDFIKINYSGKEIPIMEGELSQPVFYSESIRDIAITFDENLIDEESKLYGKQHIDIEVRVVDRNNRLLDIQHINNVVVCPGENSPRFGFYSTNDCNHTGVNLNNYLVRKTYDLDAFDQIIIVVKHNAAVHGQSGYSRRITILSERSLYFDVQVSFPTGLLVKYFNEDGIGNLTGVSTSMLAQLGFYDKKRVGRLLPFRLSVGFMALNAFNFSDNAERDLGLVFMGSFEPIRRRNNFSLPIYLGAGYNLEGGWMMIFGPGLQFQF